MPVIGPPQITNSSRGERPLRQISDGRGGFVLTPLSEQEMAERDAEQQRRREEIDRQNREIARARLGDPGADQVARQVREQARPGLFLRLRELRGAHADAKAETERQRASVGRAQHHLERVKRELAEAEQRHREHEQQRMASITAALSGGHEVSLPDGSVQAADVDLSRSNVGDAEMALGLLEGELERIEAVEQRASGAVYAAVEAILADEAETMVDELIEHEARAATIRTSLWTLGALPIPAPGRTHPFKVSARVAAAVNGSGAARTGSPSIDWASRLRALIAGEE
jgi:hypothetical protein